MKPPKRKTPRAVAGVRGFTDLQTARAIPARDVFKKQAHADALTANLRALRALILAAPPLFVAWQSRPTLANCDALLAPLHKWRALRAGMVEATGNSIAP